MRRAAVVVVVILLGVGAWVWVSSERGPNRSGLRPNSRVTLVKNVWADDSGAYICPVTGLILTSSPPQCGAPQSARVRLGGVDVASKLEGMAGRDRWSVVQFTGTVSGDGNSISVTEAQVLRTGKRPGAAINGSRQVYADARGAFITAWGTMGIGGYYSEGGPNKREMMVELEGFDVRPLLDPVAGEKDLATAELALEGTVGADGNTVIVTSAHRRN